MTGKCEVCSLTKLTCDNFNTSPEKDSTSDGSSDTNEESCSDGDSICYYKWARCDDNKLQKVLFKTSIDESIHLLNSTVKTLKHHIHVKYVQFKYYNDAKANLAKNEILIHVDYSESYENNQQREIQSAYFGHTKFSIFTACCYLRDVGNKVISEPVTITSELSDHSRAAAITCILKIIDHLREKQHLLLKINAVIWSDGCSAQFRSRFVFKLLAGINSSINITWCYNERHHGKGSMHGIGGTIKNCVYRDVMSAKCVIDKPKEFAEHAEKVVKGITSLYLPAEDVLVEPDDIEVSPRMHEMLEVHMVKRRLGQRNVPYLEFYRMATDTKPFFTQFYEEGACGHQKIAAGDNHCRYCLGEYQAAEEWLQCPICQLWFHNNGFYD